MRKLLRIVLYFYILVLLFFAVFLIYLWIYDYKPDEKSAVYYSENPDLLSDTSKITLLTWNVGYFGQDQETGETEYFKSNDRNQKIRILNNSEGIRTILMNYQNTDFILLQEIDIESKRSGGLNEYNSISALFPDRKYAFAFNYFVRFIPAPVLHPTGRVKSGLMTISKYTPAISIRYAYPEDEEFPKYLIEYDRCFLVNRYKLSNEKELVIVNLQNSNFETVSQKDKENAFLFDFLLSEFDKGNFIIVGGDWNQTPASFKSSSLIDRFDEIYNSNLNIDTLKDWKCLYDPAKPTSRNFEKPYTKGLTLTSITDFYLISPNIETIAIDHIDMGFKFTAHQPIKVTLKLKL